jgi:hypothetical protein
MTSSKLGTDLNTGERVDLHKASRRQGTYFIAATGVGKSTSLRGSTNVRVTRQH